MRMRTYWLSIVLSVCWGTLSAEAKFPDGLQFRVEWDWVKLPPNASTEIPLYFSMEICARGIGQSQAVCRFLGRSAQYFDPSASPWSSQDKTTGRFSIGMKSRVFTSTELNRLGDQVTKGLKKPSVAFRYAIETKDKKQSYQRLAEGFSPIPPASVLANLSRSNVQRKSHSRLPSEIRHNEMIVSPQSGYQGQLTMFIRETPASTKASSKGGKK